MTSTKKTVDLATEKHRAPSREDFDLINLAAYFDQEGSIAYYNKTVKIQLGSNNLDMVERIRDYIGAGSISPFRGKNSTQDAFLFQLGGQLAVDFLVKIHYYLIELYEQAGYAIAIHQITKNRLSNSLLAKQLQPVYELACEQLSLAKKNEIERDYDHMEQLARSLSSKEKLAWMAGAFDADAAYVVTCRKGFAFYISMGTSSHITGQFLSLLNKGFSIKGSPYQGTNFKMYTVSCSVHTAARLARDLAPYAVEKKNKALVMSMLDGLRRKNCRTKVSDKLKEARRIVTEIACQRTIPDVDVEKVRKVIGMVTAEDLK